MDTEKELREWINRPDLNFIERLNFGMKVWNSIEFVLLTKQEIVVDEFCNNLPKLREEIKQFPNNEYKETAWQKIVEFLGYGYSSGAVGVSIKEKLIKTLISEAEISIKETHLSDSISSALLITLQNASLQNYYKSNAVEFARFLGVNIRYLTALMQLENVISDRSKTEQHIGALFASLKSFIKQTPFLDEFKSAFAAHILPAMCELVTLSQNRKINSKSELLSILQELYFDGNQTAQLKQYLSGMKSKSKTFHEIFETPMHTFLTVVEAVILSFKNDGNLLQVFFSYLFNENDGKFRKQLDESIQIQLNGLAIFILMLKKYDVPRYFQVESIKANAYLGKQIEHFVNTYHLTHMYEVLNVLCSVIKLDAMILEHSLCQIAVKFMLVAKKEEAAWDKYEEFMFLVIETYRKLSRAEKFISQLTKNLNETLSTVKLSKKLKRSFNDSFIGGSSPTKKLKSSTGNEIEIDTSGKSNRQDDPYVKMFEANILQELAVKLDLRRNIGTNYIWSDIAFAFSPAICSAYTRFIGGLVSKPSLVVWKTLMFTLKDYVQQLKESDEKCTENCIFLIEITSALLSHYFMGCRLAEQSDKIWDAIEKNRNATREILGEFGHAILNQEHNYRTMNAFLRLCYSASNFDLLCFYYRPDSMSSTEIDVNDDCPMNKFSVEENVKKLHAYLTEKEWITIEQRITNFGKRVCKANINRIYLQRLKSNQLFEISTPTDVQDVSKFILSTAFKDSEQVSDILNEQSMCIWFIGNLNAAQKRTVCELLLQSTSEFDTLNRLSAVNDWQFIEILTFSIYKTLIEILAAGKHSDYLTRIDFEAIFKLNSKKSSKDLTILIEQQCNETKCADRKLVQKKQDNLLDLLHLLQNLPIGFGRPEAKGIVSLLNMIVYRYFAVSDDILLSEITSGLFKVLFHFGEMPNIFRNLKVNNLITLLKDDTSATLIFSLIFEKACRDLNEINTNVLDEFIVLLELFENNAESQQRILLQVAVLIVVDLSKDKKNRSQYERFRNILMEIITNKSKETENIGWLMQTTLPAFMIIVRAHVDANKTADGNKSNEIIKLMKLYLNNTVDSKNQHSMKLLNTAIVNRAYFHLTDDEIKDLVTKYWVDFKIACSGLHDDAVNKTMNNVFKLIADYKSIDEWAELLAEVEKEIEASIFTDKSKQQSKTLASMAKCQYNKSKSQIFSEFFKNVTRQIYMTIRAKDTDLINNFQWILNLLECYTIITNTSQTPLSAELIDDILSFLATINVKKIDAEQFGTENFKCLVEQMCALCLGLIQHRFVFVMDRVPHFANVFKDLLQTICWYKSNRSQQTPLEQAEITMLAEMAHSLEKTNKYFVKHSMEVKRVAPYLLLSIINLMITNDRPTTHYSQIKTHIEYICYDLIAVCDHRVEGFILRSCNEASKNIYENLHREYEKYFKFKGKV